MALNRRQIIKTGVVTAVTCCSVLGAAASLAEAINRPSQSAPFAPAAGRRSRLIFVNDLSGDIDGLFSAVHAILSPSTDLRAIVATGTGQQSETAERSAALANEILDLMNLSGKIPVVLGAPGKIKTAGTPVRSAATDLIIAEAMRADTKLPLYVAVGGGLTEIASALMIEPKIAEKLTLIWIGGDAYPEGGIGETNFNIDPLAAQYIYNETRVRIWQIPRNVYATCVVSVSELQAYVAPHGAIGEWLYGKVVEAPSKYKNYLNMGETWTLGDNPLVVLTALADWPPSAYSPMRYERTGSSLFEEVIAPHLNQDGTFTTQTEGRKIRIYKTVDNRLMLNDFFAKLRIRFPGR